MKGEKATNCWFEHSCNLEDSGCFFGGTIWLPQYSEMIPFDKIVLGHSLDRRCENVRLRPLLVMVLTSRFKKRASLLYLLFTNVFQRSITFVLGGGVRAAAEVAPFKERTFLRRRPTVVAPLAAPRMVIPWRRAPAF